MKDDCALYREKLSAYMDGQLSPDEMARVAAHLETCTFCAAVLENMRRLDKLAEDALPEFDDALMENLANRIAENLDKPERMVEGGKVQRPKIVPVWYRYAAVAASVIIVFLAGRMALKESGGDLLRPAVSEDVSRSAPTDTVFIEEGEDKEPPKPDDLMTGAAETRGKKQSVDMIPGEEKPESKKGERVPEQPIMPEETANGQVQSEQILAPAKGIEATPQIPAGEKKSSFRAGQAELADAEPSAKIKGRVIDATTGRPLSGVTIQVEGTHLGAKSDFEGEFIIRGVPPDTYNLIYSSVGYQTTESEIAADTGQMIAGAVSMERAVLETGAVATVTAEKSADLFVADSDRAVSPEAGELQPKTILPDVDSLDALYATLLASAADITEGTGVQPKAAYYLDAGRAKVRARIQQVIDSLGRIDTPSDPDGYLTLRYLQAAAAVDLGYEAGERTNFIKAADYERGLQEALRDLEEKGYDSEQLDKYRRAIDRRKTE